MNWTAEEIERMVNQLQASAAGFDPQHPAALRQSTAANMLSELVLKLDVETKRADAQEQRGDAYCDKVADLGAKLEAATANVNSLSSRLEEIQKCWDDAKRRYDATDKAFHQVCDERDALSSRLDAITKLVDKCWFSSNGTLMIETIAQLMGICDSGVERREPDMTALVREAAEQCCKHCGEPHPDNQCIV